MTQPLLLLESPWAGITILSLCKNNEGETVDFTIEQINTTAQSQFAYMDIQTGKKFSQVFPMSAALLSLYRNVVETKNPVEYQVCLPHKGTDVWWRNRCFVFNNDSLVLISENITLVKNQEAELKDKNALLKSMNEELQTQIEELKEKDKTIQAYKEFERLLESLPQLVWTTNPYMTEGKAMYINQKWYEYTGLSTDKSFNDIYRECVPVEQQEVFREHWQRCSQTHETFEREILLRRYDGAYRWHISIAVYSSDTGHWVGTFTDIHDQKLFTEQLADKNKQLTMINTDLDNFIYTASHDLKSPIANIEGLTLVLTKKLTQKFLLDDEQNRILSMIAASADRLKSTIANLTEIAKAQKEDEEEEIVSIAKVIDEVRQDLDKHILDNQVVIHKHIEVDEIRFAPKNIRSILYNLLSNAIKYRSSLRAPEVVVETRREEGYLLIGVKDNGIGIAQHNLQKVFTMFKRFHTHVEGTGIGLYIIKRIVENAGGKIEVESQVNIGTTFKVYLPYHQ